MLMEGIPGNYGGIMPINVIISYHKKNEEVGSIGSLCGLPRAQDGQQYERMHSYGRSYDLPTPPPVQLFHPPEVGSGNRHPQHPENRTLISGGRLVTGPISLRLGFIATRDKQRLLLGCIHRDLFPLIAI